MTGQEITIILESIMAESAVRWTDRERKLKLRNWIEKLSGLTSAQGKIGLDKALDHPDSFMPGVGQFREMCLSGEGCSSIEDQAHTAWALVIQHLNAYSSPIFKDSAIAESIRSMGGWRSLCSMETAVEAFRKKDFSMWKRRVWKKLHSINDGWKVNPRMYLPAGRCPGNNSLYVVR